MSERTGHPAGTPSWIDIGTDVDGAKAFYTGLFGWDTEDAGPPGETGGYGFFTKGGKQVAGYGPQQNPGPPFWTTYVAVDDADVTTKKVEAAGGTVVVAPMDVMDAGRMAVFQDPQGAYVSAWQSGQHKGAQIVNEPGAFCWSELNARDIARATAFYAAAFGWEAAPAPGNPAPYTEWKLDGRSIAGMMPMPDMVPTEVPSHWLVYFAVDDLDGAVASAKKLGGTVPLERMDSPAGPFAMITDPQGAAFAVIQLSQPDQ